MYTKKQLLMANIPVVLVKKIYSILAKYWKSSYLLIADNANEQLPISAWVPPSKLLNN